MGGRQFAVGITYSEPLPLKLYAIWCLRQGIPVGVVDLTQPIGPAPHADCVQVIVATDQHAMWGRKCPNCSGYWRTGTPGLFWTTVCCYCGQHSRAHECLSDAQRAYVESCCLFYQHALSHGGQGLFTIKARDLVAQAMASEDGAESAPPDFFVEKSRQTRFTCEACGSVMDILGRFAYCSSCGTRNDGTMFQADVEAVRARLTTGDNPTLCLKELVDAFDAVGRNIARQLISHVPMTKARREKWSKANFQQISSIASDLKRDFDIDLLRKASQSDTNFVTKMFHRRHLHAHSGGIVDQKYLDDTGDTTVQIGQLLRERREDILALTPIVAKIVQNLMQGFHEIVPVNALPISVSKNPGLRQSASGSKARSD